ncbi:dihydropteroate synthase [Bacillus sp. WMMC1349]|uniref:dihydropteroate synthase n=1 Tax=Bacillus sp. WMMC1349 TaxID=2736254 RepID=UPI00155372FF|nr:dihydropteroate synthase [Bacillus sp. WMMC1349]NPC90799.1 dihydropteroate synthase [Bacillus sp. WMMC1349]NPC91085.1 dihydropteroate synthase [Bacillus sp. WMMC1349]
MTPQTLIRSKQLTAKHHTLSYEDQTLIMGILNVTPDSFSDGGKYNSIDRAVIHAKQLVKDGAHILDIGGESTRPGADKVSLDEELTRVIPIIEKLVQEIDVPISIDTYKAKVADEAIKAGAVIINDVWGAKADPQMASITAAHDVPIVLMHNRKERNYTNLIPDMISDLMESVSIAKTAGVKEHHIVIDPGIGFAKTYSDNLAVMKQLEAFCQLGYPVLLGTSRKTFIGRVLDLPPEERAEGTGATVCLGIQKGCDIVRVHDVKQISRMAKMMDAMMDKGGVYHR